jgi:hypothetical protein
MAAAGRDQLQTMAIDALKVARRLQAAGFNETPAEALVAAVQESAEGANLLDARRG